MDLIGLGDASQPVREEPESAALRPVSDGSPDELTVPSFVRTVTPSAHRPKPVAARCGQALAH